MKERSAAFLQLGATLVIMFGLLALGREFDWILGLIFRALILVASALVLWRAFKGPKSPAEEKYGIFPSWADALPRKWRKRVLGDGETKV